jgi:N-acetylglucosamine malate deacetylase 1
VLTIAGHINLHRSGAPDFLESALSGGTAERFCFDGTRSELLQTYSMNTSRYLSLATCLLSAAVSVLAVRAAEALPAPEAATPPEDGKLRIICFGAHPDDCEIQAGGTAAMWAAKGHKVKFVSVTNGDIGHWRDAGGPLARRRIAEVQEAARILGITTQVLDIHDGELMPTLENRRTLTRLIREWKADIVMGPRPNDYHPDHRYTGILVQDAAYMVTVPHFCPDVPFLRKNPVFFYYPDSFQKPNPIQADIAISIDSVIEKKLDALGTLVSQFAEGGANGYAGLMPDDPEKQKQRHQDVRNGFSRRSQGIANRFRAKLADWYGKDQADQVKYAEAFEICEYGARPDKAELARLFPFFEK